MNNTETSFYNNIQIKFRLGANNTITEFNITLSSVSIPTDSTTVIKHTTTVQWIGYNNDTGNENVQPLPKSGSPIYITGKNLLIGKDENEQFTIESEGFIPYSSNDEGNCEGGLQKGSPLKFGVDSSFICSIDINQTSNLTSLPIFEKNIEEIKKVGIIGASVPTKAGDWFTITEEENEVKNSNGIQNDNEADNKYNVTNNIYLVVLTSTFDPKSNPQSYVLDARIITTNSLIELPDDVNTTITIKFSTKYISVNAEQFKKDDKILSYQKYNESIASE